MRRMPYNPTPLLSIRAVRLSFHSYDPPSPSPSPSPSPHRSPRSNRRLVWLLRQPLQRPKCHKTHRLFQNPGRNPPVCGARNLPRIVRRTRLRSTPSNWNAWIVVPKCRYPGSRSTSSVPARRCWPRISSALAVGPKGLDPLRFVPIAKGCSSEGLWADCLATRLVVLIGDACAQ